MALHHSPRIITDGLVLHLDAGDPNSYPGSGTTLYDLTSNGYTHSTGSAQTTFGGAACFNCTSTSTIVVSSSTYTFGADYTMIAWANALSDSQVNTWRTLWRTRPDDHPLLIQDGTDLLGYYDNNAGGFTSYGATLGGLGLANRWVMFTVMGSAGNTSLYYDAANLVGTVAKTASGLTHNDIGNTGGSQPFGYIATASLYNRAMPLSEIRQNFYAHKNRFGL